MKILFLLTQDLNSPSGLGRYLPLAQGLAKLGHQVQIAALHAHFTGLEQRKQEIGGVQIEYVAQMHVMKSGSQKNYFSPSQLLWITAKATWALAQAALRSDAEIIHIAKPHPMNSVAGLIAKYSRRRKIILDCDDYEAGSNRYSGGWQQRGVAFFERQTPKHARMVTTNTHFMQNKLIEWGIPPERILYLPNGVDPARFPKPDPQTVEQKQTELGLIGKKVVAYIGSMSLPSHPVDLLLEAFVQIQVQLPETILLMVGGGEDLEGLRAQANLLGISGAVRFVGRVSPEDVALYYALVDVTVDPVRDDPAARGRSPLKLFESWLCEVPFVTADVGDRAALMGSPPAGVLTKPGETETLAKGILEVLSTPGLAQSLRERGSARVPDFYWDRLSKKLASAYLEIESK